MVFNAGETNVFILSALILFVLAAECTPDEPPFPHMMDSEEISHRRIHILSESIDDQSGYQTIEEFVDLDIGKETCFLTSRSRQENYHLDARAGFLYRYSPYSCTSVSHAELPEPLGPGSRAKMEDEDGKTIDVPLIGVSALWLFVGRNPKTYAFVNVVYSSSKDSYQQAHRWTAVDKLNKNRVQLFFSQAQAGRTNEPPVLTLEMLKIESIATNETIRIMNIFSIERSIEPEIYDNLLQVPVGYGCIDSKVTSKMLIELPSLRDIYYGPLAEHSHRVELEATATKFESTPSGLKRTSDTIGIELASSKRQDINDVDWYLQLIRKRTSEEDIKTIMNYKQNVQYIVDSRRGTCQMSNIGPKAGSQSEVSFSNGLKLSMDNYMIDEIFIDLEDYYFIKEIKKESSDLEYIYFEKTSKDLIPSKISRIIRTYTRSSLNDVKLDSVKIMVFENPSLKQITESYHLNIVDARQLFYLEEMAKLFDVVEECYLNNDAMRVGHDYVWFEVSYSAPNSYIQSMIADPQGLKEIIYSLFQDEANISFFRVPRIEIMFADPGFVVRVLLLDLPAFPILFYNEPAKLISYDKSKGDLVELAADLDHCADLCRLHYGNSMSYCASDHTCTISADRSFDDGRILIDSPACNTYTLPTSMVIGDILELSLKRVIGIMQHTDYETLKIPKIPDELTLSRDETGLEYSEYQEIFSNYTQQFHQFLQRHSDDLPKLVFLYNAAQAPIVLAPRKFELEDDPLSKFDSLNTETTNDIQDNVVASFHSGLSLHRYKTSITSQKNTRQFSGLQYDQCALACIDSKCSSFSYCNHRQECVLTDIYNIGEAISDSIDEDPDCFISQRDFLSKFNRFDNVFRPSAYKKNTTALNPSECAHACMVEGGFNCLAFDYCSPVDPADRYGTCFYQEQRLIYTGADDVQPSNKKETPKRTGCDHYSRSYLADFLRIEYRQIVDEELNKLKMSTVFGYSVDRCAEICATELVDCSAFQFCFDAEASGMKQSCTMIEGRAQGSSGDYQVVVNESSSGDVVEAGKFLSPNFNCHVFSLRRDSTEAQTRDLALNSMTSSEYETGRKPKMNGGMSLGGGILLYLCLALVFTGIGCGFYVAQYRVPYVREKMERLQLLFKY